jgi:hypothetical protein
MRLFKCGRYGAFCENRPLHALHQSKHGAGHALGLRRPIVLPISVDENGDEKRWTIREFLPSLSVLVAVLVHRFRYLASGQMPKKTHIREDPKEENQNPF